MSPHEKLQQQVLPTSKMPEHPTSIDDSLEIDPTRATKFIHGSSRQHLPPGFKLSHRPKTNDSAVTIVKGRSYTLHRYMRYYTMLPASITCRRCKHESSKSLYIYCRWSIPTEVRFVPYPVCTYCRIKDRAGAAVRAARARQHQIPDEELKEALGHEMHGYIKLAAAPLAEHGLMDPRQLEVLKMWAAYCVDLKVRFGASWPVRIGSFPPAGELIALPASPAETEDAAGERPFYDPIRDSTRD